MSLLDDSGATDKHAVGAGDRVAQSQGDGVMACGDREAASRGGKGE